MKPRVIGLTGGIASGKSEAAKILEAFGAAVIDADKISRECILLPEIHARLKQEWPLAFDGEDLDRKTLRQAIFDSKSEREKLNSIIHPMIISRILGLIGSCQKEVCVLVAPLLIEAGLHHMVDEVWVIKSGKENQISRLAQRDKISREEALRMVESQLPEDEKLAHADRIFDNTGASETLRVKLREEWEALGERLQAAR